MSRFDDPRAKELIPVSTSTLARLRSPELFSCVVESSHFSLISPLMYQSLFHPLYYAEVNPKTHDLMERSFRTPNGSARWFSSNVVRETVVNPAVRRLCLAAIGFSVPTKNDHAPSEKARIERVRARSEKRNRRRVQAGQNSKPPIGVACMEQAGELKHAGDLGHDRRQKAEA